MARNTAKVAYGVSVAGLLAGAAYYIVRAYTSQSSDSDSELLIVAGALLWLPISVGILTPAWLMLPKLAQSSSAAKHRRMTFAAVILPMSAILFGIVVQGSDWDELLLFVIPFLPTVLVVAAIAWTRSPTRG